MLKSIRKNSFFNSNVRNLLKKSQSLLQKIINKWRLSGSIPLRVGNHNLILYNQCDDGIIDKIFYDYENYIEKNDIELFLKKAEKSNVIIDIGANTGLCAITAAIHNPTAQIYAFEPNPNNLKRLYRNINLNKLQNIKVIPQAIGDNNNKVSFNIPEGGGISDTSSVLKSFSQSTYKGSLQWKNIEVEQVCLDNIAQIYQLETVDLIKIDVEGYEVQVFEGGKSFFLTHNPMILCEVFLTLDKKHYFEKFLQEYNYYAYLILKQGILYLGQTLIPNPEGLNFLFVRKKTRYPFLFFKSSVNILEELT